MEVIGKLFVERRFEDAEGGNEVQKADISILEAGQDENFEGLRVWKCPEKVLSVNVELQIKFDDENNMFCFYKVSDLIELEYIYENLHFVL